MLRIRLGVNLRFTKRSQLNSVPFELTTPVVDPLNQQQHGADCCEQGSADSRRPATVPYEVWKSDSKAFHDKGCDGERLFPLRPPRKPELELEIGDRGLKNPVAKLSRQ
jgi:hypothetical protein